MALRMMATVTIIRRTAPAAAQPAAPAPRPPFTPYDSQLRSAEIVGTGAGNVYGQEMLLTPAQQWRLTPGTF